MNTPTFKNPPIEELVLGVQFLKVERMTSAHFGRFWDMLGDEWTKTLDRPPIEDQFETFESRAGTSPAGFQFRLEPVNAPGRMMYVHRQDDRLIQLQPTRFHLNWRRKPDGIYLSYKRLIDEFEEHFKRFREFVARENLDEITPNQWELTYIDAFAQGEHWNTPADWSNVLPGLFGTLFSTDNMAMSLERRRAEWSYELEPKRGRLHIAAHLGRRDGKTRDDLMLTMTARGAIDKGGSNGAATIRDGLDLGHDAAVEAFLRVVNRNVQESWGHQS